MPDIKIIYSGSLRTKATHTQSGNTIITDAPTDNNGRGKYFSPTDLVASALGSCILTIMAIVSERHSLSIKGTYCKVSKLMDTAPRKISSIIVKIFFPCIISDKMKKILEQAANSCPVHHSLHIDIKKEVTFHYPKS